MSVLDYFKNNPKARDLASDLKNEYLTAQKAILTNDAAIKKLVDEPVSRTEVMRIFRDVIKARAAAEWLPELDRRIDKISDPDFEESGPNSEYYLANVDPIAFIGTPYNASLALMALMGDVLMVELEKRVNAHIPASANLTVAAKKAALAKLREQGQALAKQRDDALTAYRHLSGDKSARIE